MDHNILHRCEKCGESKSEGDFLKWTIRENKQKICKFCRRKIRYEMRKVSGYFSRYYNQEEIKERRSDQVKKRWADVKADPIKYAEWKRCNTERNKRRRKIHVFKRIYGRIRRTEGVIIKPIEWYKIAKRQRCRCALTGRRLTSENISVDHIIPKKAGGKTEIGNLRFVITEANVAKWYQTDDALLSLCKDIISTLSIK